MRGKQERGKEEGKYGETNTRLQFDSHCRGGKTRWALGTKGIASDELRLHTPSIGLVKRAKTLHKAQGVLGVAKKLLQHRIV